MSSNFERMISQAKEALTVEAAQRQAESARREAEADRVAAAVQARYQDARDVEELIPRVTRALKVAGSIVPRLALLPYSNDQYAINYKSVNGVTVIPDYLKDMGRRRRYERFVRDNTLTGWDMHTRYASVGEDGAGYDNTQYHDLYLGDDARVYIRHDGIVAEKGTIVCLPSTAEPDVVLSGLAHLVVRHDLSI